MDKSDNKKKIYFPQFFLLASHECSQRNLTWILVLCKAIIKVSYQKYPKALYQNLAAHIFNTIRLRTVFTHDHT